MIVEDEVISGSRLLTDIQTNLQTNAELLETDFENSSQPSQQNQATDSIKLPNQAYSQEPYQFEHMTTRKHEVATRGPFERLSGNLVSTQ